jgi:hypothetical protein
MGYREGDRPGSGGCGLVDRLVGQLHIQINAVMRKAYKLEGVEGFNVQGSTVKGGAFYFAVDCIDSVRGIYKDVVLIHWQEKRGLEGPLGWLEPV